MAGDPTRSGIRTLFAAIELSKKIWLVALWSPVVDRVSLHRLPAGDAKALLACLERAKASAQEALGQEVEIMSCFEAGYDGFWLHRVLTSAGITNLVVDAASIQVDRRARRVKTDRIDAQALLRSLMAHHRGEARVWSVVRVPTPDEEDAKRTHRERQNLIKERGRHVNRIKGLCAQQGIFDYEPMRSDRRERLECLVTGDGRAMPPRLLAELRRELDRLEFVMGRSKRSKPSEMLCNRAQVILRLGRKPTAWPVCVGSCPSARKRRPSSAMRCSTAALRTGGSWLPTSVWLPART